MGVAVAWVVAVAGGGGGVVLHAASVTITRIGRQTEVATRKARRMIESGFWIFLVEAGVAGCLFAGLIWWVVSGTGERDRKLREADEKLRKGADAALKDNAKPD